MQTLESQLFVITFVLALLIVIIFLYKVMLRSLGGPDRKEKKPGKRNPAEQSVSQSAPVRRSAVQREENAEGGGTHG